MAKKNLVRNFLVGVMLIPLAGCVTAPPQYDSVDPFNQVTSAGDQKPFSQLALGLIQTENTRKAMKELSDTQAFALGKNRTSNLHALDELDAAKVADEIKAALSANFQKVVVVNSIQEAKAQGCSLAMALDLQISLTRYAPGTTTVALSGAFTDTAGQSLELLSASAEGKVGWLGGTFAFRPAWQQTLKSFSEGLRRSAKLAAFASRVGRSPQAEVPHAEASSPAPAETHVQVAVHSDVDKPRYKAPEHPNDFAVVVGVEKYSNDLPQAQFAERDAEAVRQHLVALGYPERNIKFLVGNRASKSQLEAYLQDWLPRNVKEDSRVFFYFSGHGAPDFASHQAYLVPYDGDPNFLNKTAYPLKRLYVDLKALKVKRVIVVLDSCFSGAGGRSVLAEGARPLVMKLDTAVEPDGMLVLFAAASAQEITSTLKEQGHGIFTYYFLKGLGGAAENKSGTVTFKGLYDYLRPKVQDEASRQNRDQTPLLEGSIEGEIIR